MPQKSTIIPLAGYDISAVRSLAYGVLTDLDWKVEYASPLTIVAYTLSKGQKRLEEITVQAADGQITITSKLINGEVFDMPGRNKKNIAKFLLWLDKVKASATEQQLNDWAVSLAPVEENTIAAVEELEKETAEIDKVMNISKSNLTLTYGIIGINVLVFIGMVISGVSIMAPTGFDIINWGGNHLFYTANGEGWRLLSCVFVHIGIIHLLFNMYALYSIGVYLEPMLGKTKFIAAYLSTGVVASLASLWWHSSPVASAGASGAIFGMYGVFLALLSTNLIPKQVRKSLVQSIGVFVVFNLMYGMKSGVDNAAHIGGLVSGLIIGYIFYLLIKTENHEKKIVAPLAIVVVTGVIAFLYLKELKNKIDPSDSRQFSNAVEGSMYKDSERFLVKYNEFVEVQNRALKPLLDTTLSDEQIMVSLNEVSMPEWEKAQELVASMKSYDVSSIDKKKIQAMEGYVVLRKEEIAAQLKVLREKGNIALMSDLGIVREKIEALIIKLQSL